ncbi:hypothetical protein [Roseococcus sp. YIM B11640]|uniref:hypothetical protein n=1 Tax=Roseococcus sp. YIM B11640 TaxID=3133973 RepID=UPI003C7997DD
MFKALGAVAALLLVASLPACAPYPAYYGHGYGHGWSGPRYASYHPAYRHHGGYGRRW